MTIYATTLYLSSQTPYSDIIREIESWATRKCGKKVVLDKADKSFLCKGNRINFLSYESETVFMANFRLIHSDSEVEGRQWSTEVGIKHDKSNLFLECSVLLETTEISAKVVAPPITSVPILVHEIINKCKPVNWMYGVELRDLSEQEDLDKFTEEANSSNREYPLTLVSGISHDDCLVKLDDFRFYLEGLSQVYFIPTNFDFTKAGDYAKFMPRNGGVTIIHSRGRNNSKNPFIEKYSPNTILNIRDNGENITKTILTNICHRYNFPNKQKHISTETIQSRKRTDKIKALSASLGSISAEQEETKKWVAFYKELEDEQSRNIKSLQISLDEAQTLWTEAEDEKNNLRYQVETFKSQLSQKPSQDINHEFVLPIIAEVSHTFSIEKSISIFEKLFPDRIIFLPTALKSAQEAVLFRYKNEAFELLRRLCTDYWEKISSGLPDIEARKVFGQNEYSAKESETVSSNKNARRIRTFEYQSQPIFMEKHLKFGTKDSITETLRIHFEWFPDEKKIIVGHCGRHLEFG